jgi:hypothetical protein
MFWQVGSMPLCFLVILSVMPYVSDDPEQRLKDIQRQQEERKRRDREMRQMIRQYVEESRMDAADHDADL